VTPSGIESVRNSARPHENSSSPTENGSKRASRKRVVTLSGSKVANLAKIAANAVRNYDLSRGIEVIEEIRRLAERETR
jgi:hypothetical protein